MQVPFVGGSYTERTSNLNAQRCVNLFPVVDQNDAKNVIALYGTPGLKLFGTVKSGVAGIPVRCVYEFGTVFYVVLGNEVYSVDSGGGSTLLGTLTTSAGNVFMSDNGTQVIIVDGTATGYLITAGVMAAITDADFPAASSVTFQDGYFIVTETGTGKIWISTLYDGDSWDPLDFATAEANPDDALCVISNAHDLWVFGSKTAEVYYNSGNADFPFERISGAILEVGLTVAASAVKINGQIYWLTDDGRVRRTVGYQGQIVSTPHIEYQFSTYSVISDARAFSYTVAGHVFYVIIFPTAMKTWVFDTTTGFWHEWESYCTQIGFTPWSRHRSNCGGTFGRKQIVGDYTNGKLYELDMDTLTDESEAIRRIRAGQTINKDRNFVVWNSFEIEFESGVGLAGGASPGEDPQACLDWSDDGGHTWSNEHWTTIGKIGAYKTRAIWRRLGISRNRVPRLTISEPVKIAIIGAYAELEACRA
jgi:hypothetical protein